ncbi:MAG: NAD(P)(+) transhydrogenase (Re/Si-specific) subunit beta [Blastomonas fulva]|nr:NAD(P)(+) transhydrogenase (Re/Si-specific) subunit beta [Blastomonas fulva]
MSVITDSPCPPTSLQRFFFLLLGGLSGQDSAKRAVCYGIFGIALAIAATHVGPGAGFWGLSLALIAGGGAVGWNVAQRVQVTEMSQLFAAMHSFVGIAAVFIGFNTHIEMVSIAATLIE